MVDVYDASKASQKKKRSHHGNGERLSVSHIRKVIRENGRDSLLSSFVTFPKRVCFETQDDGETVVLFLRQHPIVNLGWFLLSAILTFVPSFFVFFPPYAALPPQYQMVLVLLWYLLLFGYVLAKFMSWLFNAFLMTDERLVDVDFVTLFDRVISDTKIDKVQDVTSSMSGAWQLFFNYGSVFIQTAGEEPQFVFQNIPHPDIVARMINQMIDLEEQEKLEGRVK